MADTVAQDSDTVLSHHMTTCMSWMVKYIKPDQSLQNIEIQRQTVMEKLSCIELSDFLLKNGISRSVVDNFTTNEVTGECFILLTEMEIKELAPRIGDRVKLRQLITKNQQVSHFKFFTYFQNTFFLHRVPVFPKIAVPRNQVLAVHQ